jgi:acetyl-CoA hydrolase
MLNGIGGSADFLRNAKLSVMHTPSSCGPPKTLISRVCASD